MHSLSNSSKWPSCDSLPSTPSLLLSESDQTEDEADLCSSEEGDIGGGKPFILAGDGKAAPRLRLAFVGQDHSRTGVIQAEHCQHTDSYPTLVPSTGDAKLGTGAATQGDLVFSRKCAEMQRFVRPVLELLNGLKKGRFERGLSSFQQSVAMDRLQKILGILQKPDMGEKYLHTLLQVEMMLKMWFPQVKWEAAASPKNSIPSIPPRWHQNQLHIPVKKRKLSWSDSDFPSVAAPYCKRLHRGQPEESYQAVRSQNPSPQRRPVNPREYTRLEGENERVEEGGCIPGHEMSYNTDTLNRLSYPCSRREKGNGQVEISPSSVCGSAATQDNCISSTILVADSPLLPLSGHQPLGCHGGSGTGKGKTAVMMSEEVEGLRPFFPSAQKHSVSYKGLRPHHTEALHTIIR